MNIPILIFLFLIILILIYISVHFYKQSKEQRSIANNHQKTIDKFNNLKLKIDSTLDELEHIDCLFNSTVQKDLYSSSRLSNTITNDNLSTYIDELTEEISKLSTIIAYTKYLIPELCSYFDDNIENIDLFSTEETTKLLNTRQLTLNQMIALFPKSGFREEYFDKISALKYQLMTEKKKNIRLDNLLTKSDSPHKVIPYMAQIIADYETIGLEKLATSLDWGRSQKRAEKVKAIREIRRDAREMIEKNMEAKYQLAYLLNLFPNLEDVIECEFQQLPPIDIEAVSDYDKARDFLSKEEYSKLSTTERNQLALDRYINSHNKTKWQIGRDYELYIGYLYSKKGYSVDYFGERMGLEDLGRDLICKKGDQTLIIQCKYWSKSKQIHENHITQLYGTLISYCIENNLNQDYVKALLVTNTCCSDMAKKMAEYLSITIAEDIEIKEYPRIKCNIGHDEFGNAQKIYHLPFDQQYDATKITVPGEFLAFTVKEAEDAGFRRANKWFNL